MRKINISRPLFSSTIGSLALLAVACGQPSQPVEKAPVVEKSPIERLAKAAVKNQPAVSPAKAPTPVNAAESTEAELSQKKAELQAMAALLIGQAPRAPSQEERVANSVPQPEAGPKMPKTRPARRIVRAHEPVQVRPIDELANKGLASTLSDARFSEVITNWRGIKHCVKSITSRGFGGSGALKVAFKINADGSVQTTKIADASNSIAQRVGNCVTRQARKIQFPAYAGTEIVSKEAKFVF